MTKYLFIIFFSILSAVGFSQKSTPTDVKQSKTNPLSVKSNRLKKLTENNRKSTTKVKGQILNLNPARKESEINDKE